MKKILLCISLCISLCIISSDAIISPEVPGFNLEIPKEYNINYNIETFSEPEDILDNTSNIDYLTVDEYFNMLPTNMQKCFYLDNWEYQKVEYSLGDKFYHNEKQVFGITDFDNHIIYIDNRDEANKSILHEVGHRFQYESYVEGFQSQQFKNLYEEHWAEWYVNYGGNLYNYYTEKEAYAQCYEIYFLSPNILDIDTKIFIADEIERIQKYVYSSDVQKMST